MKKVIQTPSESRAEYMLRVAAAYIREHCTEGSIHYDEADCGGLCVADDCQAACDELQRERERNAPFQPVRLIVSAAVRYWEDATVNGDQDTDGTLIPFRDGILWKPVINLATGRVIDWPEGTTAMIHYKVCDAGEYWLEGSNGARMKWKGHYVPDDLLSIGDDGCGDYIILKVGADGLIQDWKQRDWKQQDINLDEWEAVV